MAWLHAVIDVPPELHTQMAYFWADALGWPVGSPWPNRPELRSFEQPQGTAYGHLQQVDGLLGAHLDVESDGPRSTVSGAVSLGAEMQ